VIGAEVAQALAEVMPSTPQNGEVSAIPVRPAEPGIVSRPSVNRQARKFAVGCFLSYGPVPGVRVGR
jgi:hypothetical protein